MAAAMLALVLLAGTPAHRLQRQPSMPRGAPALFEFAPTSGAGLPTATTLCDHASANSLLTGTGTWCLNGDGTMASGSQRTLVAAGTPGTDTRAVCPNGGSCTSTAMLRFDGTDDSYAVAANHAGPTGDFTVCALVRQDKTSASTALVSFVTHDSNAAGQRSFYLDAYNGQHRFVVHKSDASSTGVVAAETLRMWHLLCGVYDYVADGSSLSTLYRDGTSVASSAVAVGPPQAATSTVDDVGHDNYAGFPGWFKGGIRGAFFTGTALSSVQVAALARAVLADTPTGSRGEALTFTRTSAKACGNTALSEMSTVQSGRPCIRNGGIDIEGAATNLALRSEEFDNAAWTKEGSGVAAPVVTANTTEVVDPWGGHNAEKIVLPAVSAANNRSILFGSVNSTAPMSDGVWMRTLSGTATISIAMAPNDLSVWHSTQCAVTTTWARCLLQNKTTTQPAYHAFGVDLRDPAQSAQPAQTFYAIGYQIESGAVATSYTRTEGTTVARVADSASFVRPATLTNTVGCVAASGVSRGYIALATPVGATGNASGIYASDATTLNGHDGTNTATRAGLASIVGREVRSTLDWSGSTIGLTVDGTRATATYDGTIVGTNINIGSLDGTSRHFGGVVSRVIANGSIAGCP